MIDLTAPIRAIQAKYGLMDWHRTVEATQEAAALWGATVGVHCRPTGGFLVVEVAPLARVDKYANAVVKLAQAPNGRWAASVDYQCHYLGCLTPVQVWNPVAFDFRDEAIRASAATLRQTLAPLCTESCATEASRHAARQLCAHLETYRCAQLALF
jgi:hypothetical protein